MNFNLLGVVHTWRTDPNSGKEFGFQAIPPADTDLPFLTSKEIKDIKHFVETFFWWVLGGESSVLHFHKIEGDILGIFPLLAELVYSINLHRKKSKDPSHPENTFYYSYTLTPKVSASEREGLSSEFLNSLLNEVLLSQATSAAVSWYLSLMGEEVDKAFDQLGESEHTKKKGPETRANKLFPNSKSLNPDEWGMPKFFSDSLSKGLKGANRKTAIDQYTDSNVNPKSRKSSFKVAGRKTATVFVFDPEKLAIKTAEQFADRLMSLRDAKVLQTFFALMKYANIHDTSAYREIPISDVMELVLKPQGDNKFNTTQRREFSEILELLASITITVNTIGEQVDKKTGKGKAALKEEKGVKIFRLEAIYSVKKEFMSTPKESLNKDLHFDRSVINRFSGELLPGNEHLFANRASIYFDSLLHLNANYDAKAILLGFLIQTRFNQLLDKNQFIEYTRSFLIDLCDYSKVDKIKPSRATKQIGNNLDKLIKAGIISAYSGLTNVDSDRVKISPPKGQIPKAVA